MTTTTEKMENMEADEAQATSVIDPPSETHTENTETDSIYKVGWEEPANEDPENPMNWTSRRKWIIIGLLSLMTFITPLASSMMAPGVPLIMAEFNSTNEEVSTFVVSIFVLGFAFGPLLMAPLSEIYGRLPIYHVSNALFVVFTVCCGVSQNIPMLMVFRFLSGFVGVAVVTCGSGTITDLIPPEKRGAAMSIWSAGPLLGPVVGPVCAGFLVEAAGWRWAFWVITIVSGITVLAMFLFLQETYAPVLLERKAAKLRKETGNDSYQSVMKKEGTPKDIFNQAILRPARMFCLSPIVAMVCIYLATLYGLLYLLFTTFTFVYKQQYGFGSVGSGLSFISGGVGNFIGLFVVGYLSDRFIRDAKAKGKEPEPEQRLDLRLTVPFAITLPVGLIIYGWTADKHLHWICPMIGVGIMGFGMIGILMVCQTYLVDSYPLHAASVTAAGAVIRSLLGALLPLGGLKLYDALGLGWGNTLLGFIALGLAPVPWLLNRFGKKIRTSPKFRTEF